MQKTAVFFHYYELNKNYKDNLTYFISVAWRKELDFYIIDADNNTPPNLPSLPNIYLIRTRNINLDYGGYSQAIKILGDKINQYSNFVFINSSVRGPFIDDSMSDWTKKFTDKLNDEVSLVGSSINILNTRCRDSEEYQKISKGSGPFTHVQTTAYAMTYNMLTILIDSGFYENQTELKKSNVIFKYEIDLSQRVLSLGYNIDAVLPKYSGHDYKRLKTDINPTSKDGDALRRGAYFGKTPKASELIFIKTNRRLLSSYVLAWITYRGLIGPKNKIIKEWAGYKDLLKRVRFKLIKNSSLIIISALTVYFIIL